MAGRPRRAQVTVVADEPHERVFGRVAAVDVAKKDGVVCWRLPNAAGQQHAWHKKVTATVSEVTELAAELVSMGIEKVTLESTSDYWRIWLRREAPCCIPGSAGGNLEDIPGSDGLPGSER